MNMSNLSFLPDTSVSGNFRDQKDLRLALLVERG